MDVRHHRLNFQYTNPSPQFNRQAVHGVVAKLFSVRDRQFCLGLETAAGGRLYHVVTDTEVTASQLLQKGRLQRSVIQRLTLLD